MKFGITNAKLNSSEYHGDVMCAGYIRASLYFGNRDKSFFVDFPRLHLSCLWNNMNRVLCREFPRWQYVPRHADDHS